ERALAITKEARGERHPAYAHSLNGLAEVYREAGEYAKARPLYERALAITKEALGETHPLYATGLNNLAVLYKAAGEPAKAGPPRPGAAPGPQEGGPGGGAPPSRQ